MAASAALPSQGSPGPPVGRGSSSTAEEPRRGPAARARPALAVPIGYALPAQGLVPELVLCTYISGGAYRVPLPQPCPEPPNLPLGSGYFMPPQSTALGNNAQEVTRDGLGKLQAAGTVLLVRITGAEWEGDKMCVVELSSGSSGHGSGWQRAKHAAEQRRAAERPIVLGGQ